MGGVIQRCEDVFPLQKRIVRQDFIEGSARAKQFEHIGNSDALAANARAASALTRFDSDSIKTL